MKKKMRRRMLALAAMMTMLFCLSLQCSWFYVLENSNARFVSPIGEENTLIRIQRLGKLQNKADTVFMGSSMTERLLSHGRCATIAVAGSPYLTGIMLMKNSMTFPPDTVYVLEMTNMLHPTFNDITARMDKPDFKLFKTSPILSVAAKPTNLLVSSVFYLTNKGKDGETAETCFDIPIAETVNMDKVADMSTDELLLYKEYIDGIAELQRMGGKCVFMKYPRRVKNEAFEHSEDIGLKIAKHTGIPVLDYNTPYWKEKLHFSDGYHLISRDPLTVRFMNTVARDAHACTDKL